MMTMSTVGRLVFSVTAVAVFCVGAPPPVQAQAFSEVQRSEIERIIRDYFLRNPEVLPEVIAELEKRQAAADVEKLRAAVKMNEKLLFSSPRQVTIGNVQGDVTLVEFFDYNCGFCRRALADKLALMKSDANLKVVLKEFPVLGPASVEAAQVATAVRMQDRSGKKYLEFHQKLLTGRGQADRGRAMAVAREVGLDVARLEKDLASEEVRASLAESVDLAEKLGLNGTPSYVIGTEVVVGAVGCAALKEKISVARACAASGSC
jgi:protein-disulfide isomerase